MSSGGGGTADPHYDPDHHSALSPHSKVAARDQHLAILLEEITHLEKSHLEKEMAMKTEIDLNAKIAENALSYSILLEQVVVVPAVGSLDNFLSSGTSQRQLLLSSRSRLATRPSEHSEKLKKLLERFKVGPDFVQAKQRREQIMSKIARDANMPTAMNVGIEVEDSLVLIECLLDQQQQLGVLLADSAKRLSTTGGSGSAATAAAAGGGGNNSSATQEQLEARNSEILVLQSQIRHLEQLNQTNTSKLQVADEEIQRLSKAARSSGALEELQKHYAEQEEKYLQKLESAEKDRESRSQERLAEAARIDSLDKVIEEMKAEKEVMRAEMDRLRGLAVGVNRTASSDPSAAVSLIEKEKARSGSTLMSSGEHSLRMELERNIREHSTVVTQLESEIGSLRSELVHAKHDAAGATAQRVHLEELHRNNELLRQEIAQLQHRIHSHERSSVQREAEAEKVAVMESTIQQLSDEVSAVDARIRAMHAQHLAERERLQQLIERERTRFQQERDECDALVWRMTSELEFLVKDNALLKAKLESQEDTQYS